MLTEVRYNQDEYEFPCLLVLGSFDAIHAGHAELLKKAKLQAKINGLDFGVMVFTGGKGGNQICTLEEKLALIEQYNAKFFLSVEFTDDFKKTKPLDFLQIIEDKLNVKAYMSGKDFRFGAGAKGKSSTLKNYGEDEENGVWYMPVKDVTDENGEKISSTKIKELIESGEITSANALLGRNYSVSANIISTAGNEGITVLTVAYPEGKVKVKDGVYAVKVTAADAVYEGVANSGENLELHIKDFNSLPEGEKLTVEFIDCFVGDEDVSVTPAQASVIPSDSEESHTEALAAPVEELAVADETFEEPSSLAENPVQEEQLTPVIEETPKVVQDDVSPVIPSDSEEAPAEPAVEEQITETVPEETPAEQPAQEEPEAEVFAEDGGFDDDYVEEDFIEEQPAPVIEETPEVVQDDVSPVIPNDSEEATAEEVTDTTENDEESID